MQSCYKSGIFFFVSSLLLLSYIYMSRKYQKVILSKQKAALSQAKTEEAQAQRIPGEQKDKQDPHHRSHASEANRHPGLSEVG